MLGFEIGKIVELRELNKLTIEEFAAKVGTTKQAVSAWETGASVPRVGTLLRICNCFDVPVSFFISSVHQSKQRQGA